MIAIRLSTLFFALNFQVQAEAKAVGKVSKLGLKSSVNTTQPFTSGYVLGALEEAARKTKVPFELLKAICQTESGLNPRAYVHNDGGEGIGSAIGLCQVLRGTAVEFIGDDKGCHSDFRNRLDQRTYKNCKLFGPKTNALVAAKYLKKQINRYGNLVAATAAYNAGTVKICRTGKVKCSESGFTFRCTPGHLLNAYYVHRVDGFLGDEVTFSQLSDNHEVGPISRDIISGDFKRALNVHAKANPAPNNRTASS